MTSFDCRLEPRPQPRLAAAALVLHLGVAASPWLLGVPPPAAAVLSAVALAGLPSTLLGIPGPHHALAALIVDGTGCRVRLAAAHTDVAASFGAGSWAAAGFAVVDLRAGGRRYTWLVARGALAPAEFRRLKARVRLSC